MTLPAYAMNVSSFPESYERLLVPPLFRPWAEVLLDLVRPAQDERVLDVACGTGIVARLARERVGAAGRVVGVDLSPQMLAVARSAAADVEWREGSAESLPVAPDERFDIVVCQQGLQFFPDRLAAAREMRRVLVRGGRAGVATWRPLEEMPALAALHRVAERHIGRITDRRHALGDDAALETLLVSAGFRDVRVERLSRRVQFGDPAVYLHLNAMALVGMSAVAKNLSDEERARLVAVIVADSSDVIRASTEGGDLAYEIGSNVAIARA